MEKREIKTTDVGDAIFFYPLWSDDNRECRSIDEIIDLLKQAKESGATHIEWNYDSYDSDDCYIQPITQRLETDDEFNLRVKSKKEYAENQKKALEEKERADYEKLKLKFEGK